MPYYSRFVLSHLQILSVSVYCLKQPPVISFSISNRFWQLFDSFFRWEEERCNRSFDYLSTVPSHSLIAPLETRRIKVRVLFFFFFTGKYDLINCQFQGHNGDHLREEEWSVRFLGKSNNDDHLIHRCTEKCEFSARESENTSPIFAKLLLPFPTSPERHDFRARARKDYVQILFRSAGAHRLDKCTQCKAISWMKQLTIISSIC